MPAKRTRVLLADDSLIVREGLRMLLGLAADLEVVGVAADLPSLVAAGEDLAPDVVVTDIRMPPTFQQEGIEGAREIRHRHPGTGIVILSQYDSPEYAVALLAEGAAGCAYLIKDRVADGEQLVRAIRAVSAGGSVLDPVVVESLARPLATDGRLSRPEQEMLRMVAEGRHLKAIAAARGTTPASASGEVDRLFLKLARQASAGAEGALRQLKALHQAIVDREEQGELLSRLLPGGLADELRRHGQHPGQTTRHLVTVLMSDVRGYSALAERADPSRLAAQLHQHRRAASQALLAQEGTIMQFVGDAVMAVFGAPLPQPDHAARALAAAQAEHQAQVRLNREWAAESIPAFDLGIGLSSGEVAAALLGSEQRLEYSLVGDCVNLAQRLQELAGPGETVLSAGTWSALAPQPAAEKIGPVVLKGRQTPVTAYRVAADSSERKISAALTRR
jgi:class 3 adenylate cyclase/ActR/RegA family two-component response regulator